MHIAGANGICSFTKIRRSVGAILAPRGRLGMSGDIFGSHHLGHATGT